MEYPPETGWGGIGAYVACLAPALAERGHEVHVLSCVREQAHRDYRDGEVFIHRRGQKRLRGLSRLLRAPGAATRIQAALSCWLEYRRLQIDFDVIEVPDWMAEGLALSLLQSRPVLLQIHSPACLIRQHNGRPPNWDGWLSDVLERTAARHANFVTCPSNLVALDLKELGWLRGEPVKVVPCAIDEHNWKTVSPVRESAPSVLAVGRLEALKDPKTLVEAVGRLSSEIEDLQLTFVGRSADYQGGRTYSEWLSELARSTGVRCRFIEHVARSELRNLYSAARVVALPSKYDNFPMVALEAMACGRPVVCTSRTGVAELVFDSGAGQVVRPNDPEALADALRPFLSDVDRAEQAGRRGLATAAEICSAGRIADKRIRCYEQTVAEWQQRRRTRAENFRYASPRAQAGAPAWNAWAVEEAISAPWKHFYLKTAEQLLELLQGHFGLEERGSLSGLRILDVGCTPALSALLAALGAEVIMLDLAEEELVKGQRIADRLELGDVLTGVLGDAFRLPFKEHSFDLVWNSGFIEHFEDPVAIVTAMAHLARRGGAVCVLTPAPWSPHSVLLRSLLRRSRRGFFWDDMGCERSYSPSDLRRILRAAGLHPIGDTLGNVRRSLLDDNFVLPVLAKGSLQRSVFRLISATDALEHYFPPMRRIGFMAGAIGTIP